MFMYLFRGEMTNRTLHYWFSRRRGARCCLAGKYAAGLIAAAVIFGGGALLTFAGMIWPHDAVEIQAYWSAGGMGHAFWYAGRPPCSAASATERLSGARVVRRNPIVPAAILLAGRASTASSRMCCRR